MSGFPFADRPGREREIPLALVCAGSEGEPSPSRTSRGIGENLTSAPKPEFPRLIFEMLADDDRWSLVRAQNAPVFPATASTASPGTIGQSQFARLSSSKPQLSKARKNLRNRTEM